MRIRLKFWIEICVFFPVIGQNFFLATSRTNSTAERRFTHKNSPCQTKRNVTATCSASFHQDLLSDLCTPSGFLQRRIGATCRLVCRNLDGLGVSCGRQEELAILISRLLLRMRCMYVASIRLDFH